jgi:hypothetical protein
MLNHAQKVFEGNNYDVYKRGRKYINIDKDDDSVLYKFDFKSKSYLEYDLDELNDDGKYSKDEINIVRFFVDNLDLFNFYRKTIGDDNLLYDDSDFYDIPGDYKKIVPAVSFITDNLSNTSNVFILSKDNFDLVKNYNTVRNSITYLIIDKSV